MVYSLIENNIDSISTEHNQEPHLDMKENNPLVTILMTVYNSESFIKETIQSLLNQSYKNTEILIINDGSTDATKSTILDFKNDKIHLVDNPKNLGITASANIGIGLAKGKYIARIDADDTCHPERISKQVLLMEKDPSIDICFSWIDNIDVSGKFLSVWSEDRKYTTVSQIKKQLPKNNCLANSTSFGKRSTFEACLYNEEAKLWEDYELWLHMLIKGYKIAKIPEALVQYRMHSESISADVRGSEMKNLNQRLTTFKLALQHKPNDKFVYFQILLSTVKLTLKIKRRELKAKLR